MGHKEEILWFRLYLQALTNVDQQLAQQMAGIAHPQVDYVATAVRRDQRKEWQQDEEKKIDTCEGAPINSACPYWTS